MSRLLSITQQPDGTYIVSGNTFPIKDTLKSYGGIWDSGRKAWIMPQEFNPATLPKPNADDDDNRLTRRAPSKETMLISKENTWKVKDQIVKAGGCWEPATGEWRVPIDFDMSIIPKVEPKPSRAAIASAEAQHARVIHCGLCGAEGHMKNKCLCPHCGTIGFHRPNQCPTIHPRWKFLVGSAGIRCTCHATLLCSACEYACCRDAVSVPCVCLLKTQCDTHGENCHGSHD